MAVVPFVFVVIISLFFSIPTSAKLAPDFIHPCNTTSWQCLTQATRAAVPGFVKGIPELGIPPLDPFIISDLTMALPGDLKFRFYDGAATGIRNCVVNNVTAEVGVYQELDLNCNITAKGKYTAKGRILLFDIDGDGDAKVKITNLHILLRHKTKLTTDDKGVHHIVSDGYTYKFDYRGRVKFQLTNLFKGNPELSQVIVTFLNDNWRVVVAGFGKPIEKYFLDVADSTINGFFLAVPYEEVINVPFGVTSQ